MRSRLYPAICLLLGSMACGAGAQTLKPGLWEISNQLQSSSGEMEKAMAQAQAQMAAMSPEQRKMMQDMMAKQGVQMSAGAPAAGGAAPLSVKVCMTKEMVERNEVASTQGDCKSSYSPRVGNTMKFSFVCSKPPSSGEGQISFTGTQGYTSTTTVSRTAGGKAEKMTINSQGKWLGADCGGIKPLAAAAAAK